MKMIEFTKRRLWVAIGILFVASPSAAQSSYFFEELANGALSVSNPTPVGSEGVIHTYAMNEHGEVAFMTERNVAGTLFERVRRTSNGTIQTLFDSSSRSVDRTRIGFNDFGVACTLLSIPGEVVAIDSSSLTVLGQPSIQGLNLNNSGETAFFSGGSIYTRDLHITDGTTDTILGTTSIAVNTYGTPTINDIGSAGAILLSHGLNDPPQTAFLEVYRPGNDTSLNMGSLGFPSNLNTMGRPSLNNAENVGFVVISGALMGAHIAFVGLAGHPVLPVMTAADGLSSIQPEASLNDLDAIAFVGHDTMNVEGLYVGDASGAPPLKVVSEGDSLAGSTLVDLQPLTIDAHNDAGQIAFIAELADGTRRLFRATPAQPIPALPPLARLALVGLLLSIPAYSLGIGRS